VGQFDCGRVPGWKTDDLGRIFRGTVNSVAAAIFAGAIVIAATLAVVFRYDVAHAVANATAPRHWVPGDLEAAIKTAIHKMLTDGRLVVGDVGDLMPNPGRFRRARGLKAVPV
jgi:hypothetical protein